MSDQPNVAALQAIIEAQQARIDALQRDNVELSDHVADVVLLGQLAKALHEPGSPEQALQSALEHVALLKGIPVCACYALQGEQLDLRAAYWAQGDSEVVRHSARLPAALADELSSKGAVLLQGDDLWFPGPAESATFEAASALLLGVASRALPRGVFVFAAGPQDIPVGTRVPLLQRVVEMLTFRLDYLAVLEELQRANADLDQQVASRTAELSAANELLRAEINERLQLEARLLQSQKLESIGRLAGGIAHDFNNMLSVILGYADSALEDLDVHSLLYDDLQTIKQAAERASDLTRQLLAFSRKQRLELRALDLNELVQRSMQMLSRLIGEEIELHLELSTVPPPVLADAAQLQQVLLNLAVNARDAMPRGGRLRLSTRACPSRPGYSELVVEDTGTGMAPETVEQVFEPFFTTKDTGLGTGLGLSTVHGIITQHQGRIEVSSTVGLGTCFRISLPQPPPGSQVGAMPQPANAVEAVATVPRGSEKLLVVDDEPWVMRLVHDQLTGLGYEIVSTTSPEEARRLLGSQAFDALVTDVVMPKVSGIELAQAFAGAVVFMSGYADERLDGIAGFPGVIVRKPFDTRTLATAVRQALDHRAAADDK